MLRTQLSKGLRLIIGTALLAGVLVFDSPASTAQAGGPPSNICGFNNFVIGTGTYPDIAGFPGKQIQVGPSFPIAGHTVKFVIQENSLFSPGVWNADARFIVSGCGGVAFTDGRCNQEADQTVAVYPDSVGGYFFFAVNVGIGYSPWHVTEQQLDDTPARSANYLIGQSHGVRLYRLSDGGLQVNRIKPDGTDYKFIIGTCGVHED